MKTAKKRRDHDCKLTTKSTGEQGAMPGNRGSVYATDFSPRRLLWIRTDAIGDAVLASSMLPSLKARYPNASITVVCQEQVAPLYEGCPQVGSIIPYDPESVFRNEAYKAGIQARIASVHADLCLNSVYSRAPIGDLWAAASQAPRRIGHAGDLCNMTEEQHGVLDSVYTELVPHGDENALELDRHAAFLRVLGIEAQGLGPTVWTMPEDERYAEELFRKQGLDKERTVALFAGAQFDMRVYTSYGKALKDVCRERGLRLIALGSAKEVALNQSQLDAAGSGHVNLCGQLSLRQAAAMLRRCRLAVGAETGLAHMACAVGTTNVVLVGGGHFGRFMPYSPLTSCAVLPLECYLCNWRCRYSRSHCVKDLDPAVLERAVRDALAGASERMRIYAQASWQSSERGPSFLDLKKALDPEQTELITVEGSAFSNPAQASRVEVGGSGPRTTVFCAVWHKDPNRFELLKGHQACLDAQTVPVERVYVFDGGDTPPDWLKGHILTCQESLGIYEAWNMALDSVRTPYVMNLNLDDRLNPEAAAFYEKVLDGGADLVGGDWRICFSQEETDAVESCMESKRLPFVREWPPAPGSLTRLGSGSGDRATMGPACAWRMALHAEIHRYPWKFADGTPIRIIADTIWWRILQEKGKDVRRLAVVVGHYHSHPGEQAEFRNPWAAEESMFKAIGIA